MGALGISISSQQIDLLLFLEIIAVSGRQAGLFAAEKCHFLFDISRRK